MSLHLIAAPLAFAAVAAGWLGVQRAWSRSFPETAREPDALAARRDGGGCYGHCVETCDEPCEPRARALRADAREERT